MATKRSHSSDDAAFNARRLGFHRDNEDIDIMIAQLIDAAGGIRRTAIVREMILAALKAGQQDSGQVDLKLMNSALKEMGYSDKIFSKYQGQRKVTVFGSARAPADDPCYGLAVELGRLLAEAGYMVITGGGPGIMQAANEGAGFDFSFGANIRLPFEQQANPILENNPRSISFKYFFTRKVTFIKEAHAVVLFPGGFGTQDESMETLTLLQTGKRDPVPLILIEPPGHSYWHCWRQFIESELVGRGYVGPGDIRLFTTVNSAQAAVAHIQQFYLRYHSLRYVNGTLLIRLRQALLPTQIEQLRREFEYLLTPEGTICAVSALEPEKDQPEIGHLPRLAIDFNRSDYAGLRLLIDRINSL